MRNPFDAGENWRRFEAGARRGFRGIPGLGRLGDWDGLGGNFRIGRMLASGDLRLVVLYLIEDQPRHGYDIIKVLEERTKGLYAPSPGIVYPALTFLEEAGYATSSLEGNKKVYSITEAGRAHLAENRDAVETTLDQMGRIGAQVSDVRERVRAEFTHPFGQGFRGEPRDETEEQAERSGLDAARRDLDAAVREAASVGPERQAEIAELLRKAAEAVRSGRTAL